MRRALLGVRALSVGGAGLSAFLLLLYVALRCFDACPPASERPQEVAIIGGLAGGVVCGAAGAWLAGSRPLVAAPVLAVGAAATLPALVLAAYTLPTFLAPLALAAASLAARFSLSEPARGS